MSFCPKMDNKVAETAITADIRHDMDQLYTQKLQRLNPGNNRFVGQRRQKL